MKNTFVKRIVIANGEAIGIEISEHGNSRVITGEREVILCAAAFNTPKLLMLSGVGDADELRKHSIAVVADVREVGRNLQNHPGVDVQYMAKYEDSLTLELSAFGRVELGADWILRKQGLGTSNFFETGTFPRTRDDVAFPNRQYEFLPLARQVVNGKLVPIPGFQVWLDLSRPESRGAVRVRSANPSDPPSIVFDHLEARPDMLDLVDGVRLARTMIRQPAWDTYRGQELRPGPDVISDSEIETFIRQRTGTSYHPSGTCLMGVDARGRRRQRGKGEIGAPLADRRRIDHAERRHRQLERTSHDDGREDCRPHM